MSQIFRPVRIGDSEFIALMALLMSLVALVLDTMLPALGLIGKELGVTDPNQNQLIISITFLGIGVGQLLLGPLSDGIGRKPAIYASSGLFITGCVLSLLATTYPLMLAGRLLQGLGIAGPRIITVAIIRDRYEGREMARVMSFVFTLFIIVPIVAPALGQLIIGLSHWRMIFSLFLVLGFVAVLWLAIRQPETLVIENRIPLTLSRVFSLIREVCANRVAFGYTLASGFVSGMFLAFLSTSQQILQEQYQLGASFPIYFALLSLSVGVATFVNGKIVMRFGMRLLCNGALFFYFILSLLFWLPAQAYAGHPPLWAYMGFLSLCFFAIGFVFGNLNAIAMQPMGHMAGVAAAVIGSLATLMGVPIGIYIGHSYNGTIMPLVDGFIACSFIALLLIVRTERGRIWSSGPDHNN